MSKNSNGVFMGSTEVPADKTMADIMRVLVKMKATHIGMQYEQGLPTGISFGIAIAGASAPISYRLPCRAERLVKTFNGNRDRAVRVAWRQLLRWVEAQLAMIDAGLVETDEVFMPYALDARGEQTMFEVWKGQRLLTAGKQGGTA